MSAFFSVKRLRCGLVLIATGAAAAWAQTGPTGVGSLTDFQLAGGFDADGYKTWDILGHNAQTSASDNTRVEIAQMKLKMYSGGPAIAIESTVESEAATVDTAKGVVHGQDKLYVHGANGSYSVNGNNWTWDEKKKLIQLGNSVYVSFNSTVSSSSPPDASAASPQVKILSDSLDIDQSDATTNKFDFHGHVSVTDTTVGGAPTQTTCEELVVLAKRSSAANPDAVKSASAPASLSVGRGGVEHLTATGNVVVTQGEWEASGEKAEMFPDQQQVVMSGAPKMRNEPRKLTLEGGVITWLRARQEFQVEPVADAPNAPGPVRVTLPAMANGDGTSTPGQMVITGQSLRGKFGEQEQRFDVEQSVRVEDPSILVNADHLDAEFAPAMTTPASNPAANGTPQMGKLNHLAVNGNVTIVQDSLNTTTPKAEILPVQNEILLSGGPKVVDTQSAAIMNGENITIALNGQSANVTGSAAHPAVLQLPSLAGANGAREANAYTTVTSDQVEMTRVDATATNDAYTKFTFDGNDKVSGTDLNVTCDTLEVFTDNVPAKPGEDPLLAATQVNQIQKLVARGKVDVIQTASGQGDGAQAYEARGARAEIRSRASVADQAPADNTPAEAYAYRSVELFGDPAGVEGPVRPTVVVPLLEGLGGDAGGGSQNPGKSAPTKTIITSDQQWLMTSAAGNTYYFSGNVQVDGGPLQASCDEMRAEVEPGSSVLKDIVAAGHVAIKQVNLQDTLQATAGRAEIKPGAQPEVTLSENAHVVDPAKGEDVSNADIIIQFDPNTHPSSHTVTMQQSSNLTGQKSNLRPTITFPNPAKPFDNAMNLRNKPSAGTSR